jgi:hypothetical protein
MLLGFADELSLEDVRRAIDYWSELRRRHPGEQTAQRQRDSAYLHASPTLGGMVRIDGLLDRELGEDVLTALDAAIAPRPVTPPTIARRRSGEPRRSATFADNP